MGFTRQDGPVNYLDYHKGFVEVETLAASEDFKSAESKLEALLDKFGAKFAKDLVIAAQLNALNHHSEKAVKWLMAAMKKGAKTECLKLLGSLTNNLSEADWAFLEKQEPGAQKSYLSGIDFDLSQEFHKRYQEEQYNKTTEHYRDIVYSNFNRIKALMAAGSFPGEEKIGLDESAYAPSLSHCELGNSRIIATLLHYDYPISELGEAAWVQAIGRGELHPREFATIYNFEKNKVSVLYKKSDKKYPKLADYKFNFPFSPHSTDVERVTADRFRFGICPYEVDLKIDALYRKYGLKFSFDYK